MTRLTVRPSLFPRAIRPELPLSAVADADADAAAAAAVLSAAADAAPVALATTRFLDDAESALLAAAAAEMAFPVAGSRYQLPLGSPRQSPTVLKVYPCALPSSIINWVRFVTVCGWMS